MSKEDMIILKCNPGEKSLKVLFIICADLESLLEKIIICHNNPKKSSTTKINKHTASGYSLFTYVHSTILKICFIIIDIKTV